MKWEGETERVVQDGSELVRGGPLRREIDSVRDWERSRSWADRKVGEERGGEPDGGRGGLVVVGEVSGVWL